VTAGSRHIGHVVRRDPAEVYRVAADPRNLPLWATGLAGTVVPQPDGTLLVDSPMGEVQVRFATDNAFGVLDHTVELPDGQVVLNPLRVLPHPDGSEVVFTLRRRPEQDDAEWAADEAAVRADLAALATLLERD
jgi:hypothetical protein